MDKTYYEVRRKDNGDIVEVFPSEVKAMGWFQRKYPYSFSTALAVGEYDLFKVCGKAITKLVP